MRLRRHQLLATGAVALAAALTCGLSGAAAAPQARLVSGGDGHVGRLKTGTDAAALVDGTATVKKAKTTVTLPRVLLRTYANNTSVTKHKFLYSISPSWAVTHKGKHPRFGVLPVAHTAVLGFGAVPITADLHLRQVIRPSGLIAPIKVASITQLVAPFKVKPTVVTGVLDVRISNVRVDQVPLKVGPNCRSVSPLHLKVTGQYPKYSLFVGGPLKGKVTIPEFTGCGTRGDDLDPLLNGTISGPGNMLHMTQGILGTWNTHKPGDCNGCRPPKD